MGDMKNNDNIKVSEDLNNKELCENYEEKLEEAIKDEKKKRRKLWIIIIILIILLFLLCGSLYMLGYKMGKIGYVETSSEPAEVVIEVTQKDIDASIIEDLDIFKNVEFDNKKIIAPLSQGTYNFKIENLTKENITYNIGMYEENNWDINLKYRLKLDNVYIIGNEETWVDINELNVNDIIVTDNSENIYTIEWLWEEAENDTEIGEAMNATYKLKINVNAKAYNGEV